VAPGWLVTPSLYPHEPIRALLGEGQIKKSSLFCKDVHQAFDIPKKTSHNPISSLLVHVKTLKHCGNKALNR
jgi:hypothetical protein